MKATMEGGGGTEQGGAWVRAGVGGAGDRRPGSPGVGAGPCLASACSDALPPEPTRQNTTCSARGEDRAVTLSPATHSFNRSSERTSQRRKRVEPHTEAALSLLLSEGRQAREKTGSCGDKPRPGAPGKEAGQQQAGRTGVHLRSAPSPGAASCHHPATNPKPAARAQRPPRPLTTCHPS